MADPDMDEAKQKLEALEQQLTQARAKLEPAPDKPQNRDGYNLGMKIATEVAAGLGLGLIVGYAIDQQFETRPLGILVGVMLGIIGGLWNAFLLANKKK